MESATLLQSPPRESGYAGGLVSLTDRGPAMSSTKDERPTTIAATTLTLRPVSNPPQILQSVYVRLGAPPSGAECQHDDWTGTRPRVVAVVGVSSSSAPCLYCKRAAWTRSLVSSYSYRQVIVLSGFRANHSWINPGPVSAGPHACARRSRAAQATCRSTYGFTPISVIFFACAVARRRARGAPQANPNDTLIKVREHV